MQVTRVSPLTGETNTLDLPITFEQIQRYNTGTVLLQNAFPDCPGPLREFYKSGYTPEDWEVLFAGFE